MKADSAPGREAARRKAAVIPWVIGLVLSASAAYADKPYAYRPADRGQAKGGDGLAIMPAAFLREYDPITLLYDRDMHEGPGPLDKPEPFLALKPSHPGEYRWLDPRTLEFRPTVPWKPMQTYTVKASGKTHVLSSLLSPPIGIHPPAGSEGLDPFSRIDLQFSQPVDPAVLAKLVTFEAVRLPGIEGHNARIYGPSDYRIKVSERSGHSALYSFVFPRPFANGLRIRTVVRLAADPGLSDARRVYHCDTRRDFTVIKAGTPEAPFTLNAAGAAYGREQAVRLSQEGALFVEFSAAPAALSLSQVKSLLNFSPAPRRLDWSVSGSYLTVRVAVDQERLYQVVLSPTDIEDAFGRKLRMDKPSSFFAYQPVDKAYARWGLGRGMVERHGPQHFPLLVNGVRSLDLRVYKIDPRHRAFWPFPPSPVRVNEAEAPPGPGEEPPQDSALFAPPSPWELGRHLRMLGSPHLSTVIDLDAGGVSRFKSVDLKPLLAKVSGPEKPGAYLVGFRPLDGSTERSFIRLQVTDLAVSSVEAKREMVIAVTSLATGRPVADAEVTLESLLGDRFVPFHAGRTDGGGFFRISHAALRRDSTKSHEMRRVIVRKDEDVLALDCRPSEAPPEFANNHWGGGGAWLGWLADRPYDARQDRVPAAFVFTDRPIYRPGETVYFKGMARTLVEGRILPPDTGARYQVVIHDPSGGKHEFPAKLSPLATFNDSLVKEDQPTGEYRVQLLRIHPVQGESQLAATAFAVEAYRIPKFEVKLHGPEKAPNDRPVSIRLNASYYAGGKVAGQNVAWRVTSYPYAYRPEGLAGYILSTDNRYGGVEEESRQGVQEQTDVTDDNGQTVLAVNPQSATGGNPRKYVVEATVTDVDEQTVSQRFSFSALPPFMLGFKAERHVTGSSALKAEVIALGVGGAFEAGHRVSAQLRKMSWISYLQETDFSRGKPRYRTQETSDLLAEKVVTTGAAPVPVEFAKLEPGVYVLELTARDRLGRVQSVKADIYLAGDKPVTWKRNDPYRFETVPDKTLYRPGQEARILLKSPFQKGMALAVIERPDESLDYRWVEISDGQGSLSLAVTGEMAPRIPVSFLLMRPRIGPEKRLPDGSTVDAARPQSVANTTWLKVDQSANQVKVSLEHPPTVRPGTRMDLKVSLKDAQGAPRSGEVALWLVDEAVLALAKEKPLDPLPSFTPEVRSRISLRDSRNLILGDLRLSDNPGGDGEGTGGEDLFGKVTVRKNFKTVPYWNPSLQVDKGGTATVRIPVSDDLTNFSVRAVAVSGPDRFGTAATRLKVRLPVVVQPALPRFVRYGDRFRAGGVARVVEGDGGPAVYTVTATGLRAETPAAGKVVLDANKPLPLKPAFTVMETGFDAMGRPLLDSVTVSIAVERNSDKAADAFRVALPLLPDRAPEEEIRTVDVKPDQPLVLPALPGGARPGTLTRHLLIADGMGLLKAVGAMSMLVRYPHGCTEQRISLAFPSLLYRELWARYGLEAPLPDLRAHIAAVADQIAKSQASDGLVGYWPGSGGNLHLTAYAVEFLAEVKRANEASKAGYAFDDAVYGKALGALERGLNSDYARYADGYRYYERSLALVALAKAGRLNVGYARELAAQTESVDLQSQARVFEALQGNRDALKSEIEALKKKLWSQTVFKLDGGREVFAGLQQRSFLVGARVHADEVTALATLVDAFSAAADRPPKLPLLVRELAVLGTGDGWGNTQANSLVLKALRNFLAAPMEKGTSSGTFACGSATVPATLDAAKGALALRCADAGKAELRLAPGGKHAAWQVRYSQRYLSARPGSEAPAVQKGFVVKRELIFVDAKGDRRQSVDSAGIPFALRPGDILEEHIQVQNPKDRHYVAVTAPFAAGLEYMNPRLETAGEEAKPQGATTHAGDYQSFGDDKLVWYFDSMPAGTYDFHFRLRATVEGEFSHPSARTEMMYDLATFGSSPGAKITVADR